MINQIKQALLVIKNRENTPETNQVISVELNDLEIRLDSDEVIAECNYISISLCSDILSFLERVSVKEIALEIEVLSLIVDLREHIDYQLSEA